MQAETAARTGASLDELRRALRPRNRLAEYFDLTGGAGLFPQFCAVVARLRPGMDCWIPARNLNAFTRFAERLGLAAAADCAFRELPADMRERVVGAETLCTTHAIGVRIEDAREGDSVHMFVGVDKRATERLLACGWYPVVIEGRATHKPVVDHLDFGRALGYPECCVRFFETSNNWNKTNSYAEAYLNTQAAFDHRTNCFGKNLGYSLNFHLPCRFDCAETIAFSNRLMEFLDRNEPAYAEICRQLLRKPVLSLNEREISCLDGLPTGKQRVAYSGALNLFSMPDQVMNAINTGDVIEIRGRFVVVSRGAEPVDVFECRCDEYGPHIPLLIDWG